MGKMFKDFIVWFAFVAFCLTGCAREWYVVKNEDLKRAQTLVAEGVEKGQEVQVVMPAKAKDRLPVFVPVEDLKVVKKGELRTQVIGTSMAKEGRVTSILAGGFIGGFVGFSIKMMSQLVCGGYHGSDACESYIPAILIGVAAGGGLTAVLTQPDHRPAAIPADGWSGEHAQSGGESPPLFFSYSGSF